jgi:hypothetical protein
MAKFMPVLPPAADKHPGPAERVRAKEVRALPRTFPPCTHSDDLVAGVLNLPQNRVALGSNP